MRSIPWFLTIAIALAIGAIGGVAGLWWLQSALDNSVSAVGVLEHQGAPTAGESVPPPEGYYIRSSAVERVYIESEMVSQYLGQDVIGYGKLLTICGADGAPCYPLIQAESVNPASR